MAAVLERAIEPNEIVSALGRYGLSQKDIATAAHVTERTVYAWKHEHGGVRDRNYDRLAAVREVVLNLRDSLTDRGVGQWLRACNRLLTDRRPIEVLEPVDKAFMLPALMGRCVAGPIGMGVVPRPAAG